MAIWDWSGTAGSNTSLEGVSAAEGMLPGLVNNLVRAVAAALKKWQLDLGGQPTSAGTNTITFDTNSGVTSYTDGLMVGFTAGAANTGPATLNVNSVGAQDLKKYTSSGLTALAANDIVVGGRYLATYESTNADWILLNPSASAASVLLQEGEITSATSTLDITLPTGYQSIEVVLSKLQPTTAGDSLYMRISIDAGINYKFGASDYTWMLHGLVQDGTESIPFDEADTEILLTGAMSAVGVNGFIKVEIPDYGVNGWNKQIQTYGSYRSSATSKYTMHHGMGIYIGVNNGDITTNLRFFFSTSTIANAAYRVIGHR